MTSSIFAPPISPATSGQLQVKHVGRHRWRVVDPTSGIPVAELEVIRLDHTDWRVSDASRDAGDPLRLLGYIERMARDDYEVLWLVTPMGWSYVSSLTRALAALADRSRFDGPVVARRPAHRIQS